MSIKIPNGYRIALSDLGDLYRFLMQFAAEVHPLQVKWLAEGVAADAAYWLDRHTLGYDFPSDAVTGKKGPASPWDVVFRSVQDVSKHADQNERPSRFDFLWTLILIPRPGPWTLALLFTRDQRIIDLWESRKDHVSDFHYQNSTDRPEGITSEEWEFRLAEWTEAFGGMAKPWVPSNVGFTFDPQPNWTECLLTDRLLAAMPSAEARARRVALDQLFSAWLLEASSKANGDLPPRELVGLYSRFQKWSSEATEEVNAKTAEIASRLIREIEPGHLLIDLSKSTRPGAPE